MIAFVNGTLVEKQPTRVVLDVGGVGYELLIPLSSYDRLPAVGAACRLLTHDYVREDQHVLFGFATEAERRMFGMLMGASGVGPKLALSALSGLSVREMTTAVVEGDVRRLSSVSGIGRKTAERLVVELRDKFSEGEALEALSGTAGTGSDDKRLRDAVLALAALGYREDDARKKASAVLAKAGSEALTVEDVIRRALGG